MKLDKQLRPDLAIAVAATAAVCSPQVRKLFRRGLVYGVAGVLKAGDMVSSFAAGVARGAQNAAASPAAVTGNGAEQPVAQTQPQTQGASTEGGPGPGAGH